MSTTTPANFAFPRSVLTSLDTPVRRKTSRPWVAACLMATMIVSTIPAAGHAATNPLVACSGSCAVELASNPMVIGRFAKKWRAAVGKCAKKGLPSCPAACPMPDPAAFGVSASCASLVACSVDNVAGATFDQSTWDRAAGCSIQPASKCEQNQFGAASKFLTQMLAALAKESVGMPVLGKLPALRAKCAAAVDKPTVCPAGGQGVARCAEATAAAYQIAGDLFAACDAVPLTGPEVEQAVTRARQSLATQGIVIGPSTWSRTDDFFALMLETLVQTGCLERAAMRPAGMQLATTSTDTVRYCGPGSCDASAWDCWLPHVEGTCLNAVCQRHDQCYDDLRRFQCVELSCDWSSQTAECDDTFSAESQLCDDAGTCDTTCHVIIGIAHGLEAANDELEASGDTCPRGDGGDCGSCPGSCQHDCTCAPTTTTATSTSTTTSTMLQATCSVPGDVPGLATNVDDLGVGRGHACVVTAGGHVQCWGANGVGQLGNGSTTDSDAPVVVVTDTGGAPLDGVVEVVSGGAHTCARLTSGGVKCWGLNNTGQLGNGTLANSPFAVDVCAESTCAVPLAGIRQISAGNGHTCAVRSSGGVTCWGRNGSRQLGDGTSTNRSAPSMDVAGFTDVVSVAAGRSHTCALHGGSGVTCWGLNTSGQLGAGRNDITCGGSVPGASCCNADGTCGPRVVCTDPTCSAPLAGSVAITAGDNHTCAVTASGRLRCWGATDKDQLGNGEKCRKCSNGQTCLLHEDCPAGDVCDDELAYCPLAVEALSVADGPALADVVAAAAGIAHTCALRGDGAVACWGDNENGQVGDGVLSCGSHCGIPVVVPGVSNATALAAGGRHTCIRTAGGDVRCWGSTGVCQDPLVLLARFAPILKYDSGERFFAVSAAAATDYVENGLDSCTPWEACSDPTCTEITTPPLGLDLLGARAQSLGEDGTEFDSLDLAGDDTDFFTYQANIFQTSPQYRDRVYGHVIDMRPGGGIWLGYWAFYYFNPGYAGLDDHEGDWEAFHLHLGDDLVPIEGLFYQHGGEALCTSGQLEFSGGVPVVYVAHNSHASYPRAGVYDRPPPIDDEDVDGSGPQVRPTVEVVTETTPAWIGWKGKWGSSRGSSFFGHCLGASPIGPRFKDDKWSNPTVVRDRLIEDCNDNPSNEHVCGPRACNAGSVGVQE
jgi:alpha-tubulin suppressor-like RCC1 family protein